jgi:hypothetical protein
VLHGLFDKHGAHCGAANVADQRQGAGADGLDFLLRRRRNGAGAVNSNTGSGLGEPDSNRRAEAARRTGDESGFAFEAEAFED